MVTIVLFVFAVIIGLGVGSVIGLKATTKKQEEAELTLLNAEQEATTVRGQAEREAKLFMKEANREVKALRKEALLEAKEEARKYREDVAAEFKTERQELKEIESRLTQREGNLDRKDEKLTRKEELLDQKEQALDGQSKQIDARQERVATLEAEGRAELERIASLTPEQAKAQILEETEVKLTSEIAARVREAEWEIKERSNKVAKDILSQAMQRMAGEFVSDQTNAIVHLPDDNMKGRIIGREGRNIRTFESLTGIDVLIDDTPEVVVLSGFDPIRREIARMTMEALIKDGRIHPARIEELVEKNRVEMDQRIREYGENAAFEIGAPNLHPDLMKMMGRLQFRTSYGQNVLRHSIEVAKLSGIIASELGENSTLARRAGFLHDLGKAIDREVEGSHVEIGTELARKYKEHQVVINTIASHHGDVEPTSTIAVIVAAADALSAARPGARSESLENYIQRLRDLEDIATEFDGVKSSFALQAGREIRIMVNPQQLKDDQMTVLAHKIREKIEANLEYPGNIKVTVIRETRAIEYAK